MELLSHDLNLPHFIKWVGGVGVGVNFSQIDGSGRRGGGFKFLLKRGGGYGKMGGI